MGKESTEGEESRKISMAYLMIFFLSLLICVTGGSVFGWWLYKYHPTNRQLWMVPFSLIFLFTPLMIWLSLHVSELCISSKSDEEQVSKVTRRIHPLNHSVRDPKQIGIGI
ncbi:hypothetical protein L6164_021277 [Bauhinia variegata]|uniref:Uncharacterized protein n=1 Tax=Bauhinia variegata TaxID=167791 RepID=A0ACB9MZB4_BAUVA|nr:hypothetical protein L6164_021277 [Bauhinia variegata]